MFWRFVSGQSQESDNMLKQLLTFDVVYHIVKTQSGIDEQFPKYPNLAYINEKETDECAKVWLLHDGIIIAGNHLI